MPYLQRKPRPQKHEPSSIQPILVVGYALILTAVLTHGVVQIVFLTATFAAFMVDTYLGYPRIVFRSRRTAQNRPHP